MPYKRRPRADALHKAPYRRCPKENIAVLSRPRLPRYRWTYTRKILDQQIGVFFWLNCPARWGGKMTPKNECIFTARQPFAVGGKKVRPNFSGRKKSEKYRADALRGRRKKSARKNYWAEKNDKKWSAPQYVFRGKKRQETEMHFYRADHLRGRWKNLRAKITGPDKKCQKNGYALLRFRMRKNKLRWTPKWSISKFDRFDFSECRDESISILMKTLFIQGNQKGTRVSDQTAEILRNQNPRKKK